MFELFWFPVGFVLVILVLALAIFSVRRWRKLRDAVIRHEQAQEELRRTEKKYRTLLEYIEGVVYTVETTEDKSFGGNVQMVSNQVENILGYQADEFLNDSNLWFSLLHPDDISTLEETTKKIIISKKGETREYRLRQKKTGEYKWMEDITIPQLDDSGRVVGIFGIARDITERKQAEKERERLLNELGTNHEQLQILSRRLVEVQESERYHIARELHDEIGQFITGIKLKLESSKRLPVNAVKDSLGEVETLVNELMGRVREISLNLRPAMLDDMGLLPALMWHFERYTSQTNVQVQFKHSGLEGRRFTGAVETTAYRIIQEALTNIARHAGVSEVTVRLWADQDTLNLWIEDQGVGFDPQAVLSTSSTSGLIGMRERALLLGGQLIIQSTPGTGTCLTVQLPLRERSEEDLRKEKYD